MWCPECNISSDCDCYPPMGIKYIPVDHEKELEIWLADIKFDIAYEIEREKRRKENHFNQA